MEREEWNGMDVAQRCLYSMIPIFNHSTHR